MNEVNTTTSDYDAGSKLDNEELFWQDAWTIVKIATVVISVLGLLGNFLSYKTADFMPKSNSSVLMKYLAVWDSVAVLYHGIIPGVLDLMHVHILYEKAGSLFYNAPFFSLLT